MMRLKFETVHPEESDSTRTLYKYYTSEIRTSYSRIIVGNIAYCMPTEYKRFAEDIENFEVRDDDIWVITFPKSGTTWTQEMVWLIANDLDYKGAETLLVERFPFLEFSTLFELTDFKNKSNADVPEVLCNSIKVVANLPSPRFIKSHLPWDLLPKQLRSGETKAKIIYVARNPLDVSVSYYHHNRLLENFTGSLKDYCDLFMADLGCYFPFWEIVSGFWERRHQSNILYFTYESMKRDLGSIINKVADFIGKTLSEEEIKTLEKHLSFESMKNNLAVNMETTFKKLQEIANFNEDGKFIRRGIVNSYKDEMSPDDIRRLKKWVTENLEKYKLPLECV